MTDTPTQQKADEATFMITVSAGQAHILARACELLSRVHIGQLEQVGFEIEHHRPYIVPEGETPEREALRLMRRERGWLLSAMLRNLNPLVTGHESPGYRTDRDQVPDDAHAARDMEMAIRHALWRARPPHERNDYTVDADPPRRTSKAHPVPVIGAAGGLP